MVVSVVLDTEYMGMAERNKWFLKSVSSAKDKDWVIITHEYMKTHLQEIVDGCSERFYKEFEMEHVSVEEIKKMNICYIPDSIFDDLYKANHSCSKMIMNLYQNRNANLENVVIPYLDKELKKRNLQKPTCIFNCLHVFSSIHYLSKYYSCPLIPYVFSCVRMVHGYTQTLYMAHDDIDLFHSDNAKILYKKYEPSKMEYKVLNKKEILALIGKKHNFVLFPLMDKAGEKDIGVIGGAFRITPEIYCKDNVTDDDIFYECKKHYKEENIVTRLHPLQLDQVGIGRIHMKNDPATFVLSCKRVATVQSQMILKAALWNRVTCVLNDALPYAFLFSRDFEATQPVRDEDLNFILFAYMIPNQYMFDEEYWMWRATNPNPNEIIKRNLSAILNGIGLSYDIMFSNKRLEIILKARGCLTEEICKIIQDGSKLKIDYGYASSKLEVIDEDNVTIVEYTLNYLDDKNQYVSIFSIPRGAKILKFCPQNDVDGFVSIISLEIDGFSYDVSSEQTYWPKGMAKCIVELINNDGGTARFRWSVIPVEKKYQV